MVDAGIRLELLVGGWVTDVEFEDNGTDEFSDLPKLAFLGDDLIEVDESMLTALCNECEHLGYCRKRNQNTSDATTRKSEQRKLIF